MSRIYGVVTGVVEDVEDPAGEGRIRVRFPWLPGENQSYWAPVATLMAGDRRGSWIMPEAGDEALVAFEQGDINHPFVLGFLWHGRNLPPNEENTVSIRRLKTVSGHVLEFDDRPGEEKILIKTAAGQEIEMLDTPPASVTIKTVSGQQLRLDDAGSKVELTTTTSKGLTFSDLPPTMSVSAPAATLTIDSTLITINATGVLTINAPMTIFSGVVQATTVIASSIVSPVYTPGVGNLFGL
jgi:uncharacterized protein involved in type VI secretion and phage assembly